MVEKFYVKYMIHWKYVTRKIWLHPNVFHNEPWHMWHPDVVCACTIVGNQAITSIGSIASLTEKKEKGIAGSEGKN